MLLLFRICSKFFDLIIVRQISICWFVFFVVKELKLNYIIQDIVTSKELNMTLFNRFSLTRHAVMLLLFRICSMFFVLIIVY